MRALSAVLYDLIGVAEEVVTRPRLVDQSFKFSALGSEVRYADALPAEGVRTTRAAMVMVIALEEFRNGDREPGSPWLMMAGATLPLLRGEAWAATKNEKEARAG